MEKKSFYFDLVIGRFWDFVSQMTKKMEFLNRKSIEFGVIATTIVKFSIIQVYSGRIHLIAIIKSHLKDI